MQNFGILTRQLAFRQAAVTPGASNKDAKGNDYVERVNEGNDAKRSSQDGSFRTSRRLDAACRRSLRPKRLEWSKPAKPAKPARTAGPARSKSAGTKLARADQQQDEVVGRCAKLRLALLCSSSSYACSQSSTAQASRAMAAGARKQQGTFGTVGSVTEEYSRRFGSSVRSQANRSRCRW
jgi:hypothetical protein